MISAKIFNEARTIIKTGRVEQQKLQEDGKEQQVVIFGRKVQCKDVRRLRTVRENR